MPTGSRPHSLCHPDRLRTKGLAALLLGSLLAGSCLLMPAALPAEPAADLQAIDGNAVQRGIFIQARAALQQGNNAEYQNLLVQLEHYPLLPYLEYAAIAPRLAQLGQSGVDHAEVDRFLSRYPGSYLAEKLEREWVTVLANQERWADVVSYYKPANTTTELTCHAFRAHLASGDDSILNEVGALWNVPRSQPNACDPVFDAWIAAGFLTPDIAWQRFSSTLKARQLALARYIAKQMPPREQALAETYLQVDNKPELLKEQQTFSAQGPEMREIILHGLQRLALIDARMAMDLWQAYQSRQDFDEETSLGVQRYIALRLLLQDYIGETEALLTATPALISETLVEWLLRDALKKQDWPRLETWLARLPETTRNTERWQYWQARVLTLKGTSEADAEALAIYQALAKTRSFYGFLAADVLGLAYEMVDKPIVVSTEQLQQLHGIPAIARAHELYLIGDEPNARREWQHATTAMSAEQLFSTGRLAESWGWHRNGIQAMIQVSYWDDLQIRFPLAYSELFGSAASQQDISQHLLFAIARQESAMIQDARSSAGALGLMQLMPATAQQTAEGIGMDVSNQDLLRPEINITLGSRYLSQLLQQFNGNRILAAAAYNAGPNRVKQWLNQDSNSPLPLDVWIETIPFAETRGYVQNVLAYAVIYGYRMGETTAFLTSEEADSML